MVNALFDPKRREEIRKAIDKGESPFRVKAPKADVQKLLSEGLIRGPKLEVFILAKPGATMEAALARANAEKRVIASNKRIHSAIVGSDEWQSTKDVLPCWTGTMTAYEEAGKPFGNFVEYTDGKTGIKYIFPVPDEFVGVKNGLLVAEHPDFTLETDGNSRIVRAAKVELIEKFPATNNKWYLADPAHDIPFGAEVDESNPDARYLWRTEKRVGLVARVVNWDGYNLRRYVCLDIRPSAGFGVALF